MSSEDAELKSQTDNTEQLGNNEEEESGEDISGSQPMGSQLEGSVQLEDSSTGSMKPNVAYTVDTIQQDQQSVNKKMKFDQAYTALKDKQKQLGKKPEGSSLANRTHKSSSRVPDMQTGLLEDDIDFEGKYAQQYTMVAPDITRDKDKPYNPEANSSQYCPSDKPSIYTEKTNEIKMRMSPEDEMKRFKEELKSKIERVNLQTPEFNARKPGPGHVKMPPHIDRNALEGQLKEANVQCQTTDGYEVIPELIYFNVWSKVYDLIGDLTRDLKHKQQRCDEQTSENTLNLERARQEIRELTFAQKRSANMKDEFIKLAVDQKQMKDDLNGNRKTFEDIAENQQAKIENFEDHLRVMKNDVASEIKHMKANEMSEAKVNRLFDAYSKNILEKFQQSASSFTTEVTRLEYRYKQVSEMINRNNVQVSNMSQFIGKADVRFFSLETDNKRFELMLDEVHPVVSGFDQRLKNVETNMIDVMASTTKGVNDLYHRIKDQITKEDSYRMNYNISIDLIKSLFDPAQALCDDIDKPLEDEQKKRFEPDVMIISNLMDWQIRQATELTWKEQINRACDPKRDEFGVQLKDTKSIRGDLFRLQLNSKQVGKQMKRRHSARKALRPTKELEHTCGDDFKRMARKDITLGSMCAVKSTLIDELKIPQFPRSKSFLFQEHVKKTLDNLYTFEAENRAKNMMQKFRGLGMNDGSNRTGLGLKQSSRHLLGAVKTNVQSSFANTVGRQPSSNNLGAANKRERGPRRQENGPRKRGSNMEVSKVDTDKRDKKHKSKKVKKEKVPSDSEESEEEEKPKKSRVKKQRNQSKMSVTSVETEQSKSKSRKKSKARDSRDQVTSQRQVSSSQSKQRATKDKKRSSRREQSKRESSTDGDMEVKGRRGSNITGSSKRSRTMGGRTSGQSMQDVDVPVIPSRPTKSVPRSSEPVNPIERNSHPGHELEPMSEEIELQPIEEKTAVQEEGGGSVLKGTLSQRSSKNKINNLERDEAMSAEEHPNIPLEEELRRTVGGEATVKINTGNTTVNSVAQDDTPDVTQHSGDVTPTQSRKNAGKSVRFDSKGAEEAVVSGSSTQKKKKEKAVKQKKEAPREEEEKEESEESESEYESDHPEQEKVPKQKKPKKEKKKRAPVQVAEEESEPKKEKKKRSPVQQQQVAQEESEESSEEEEPEYVPKPKKQKKEKKKKKPVAQEIEETPSEDLSEVEEVPSPRRKQKAPKPQKQAAEPSTSAPKPAKQNKPVPKPAKQNKPAQIVVSSANEESEDDEQDDDMYQVHSSPSKSHHSYAASEEREKTHTQKVQKQVIMKQEKKVEKHVEKKVEKTLPRIDSNQTSGGTVSNQKYDDDESSDLQEQEAIDNEESASSENSSAESEKSDHVSDSVDSEDLKERIQHTVRGMLKNYVKQNDMYDEMDRMQDDVKKDMHDEFTPMFEEMANQMIENSIENSQNSILQFIGENTQQMDATTKLYIEEERVNYQRLFDRIKKQIIPEEIASMRRMVKDTTIACEKKIVESETRIKNSMQEHKQNLDSFDAKVEGTLMKFHKLMNNNENFQSNIINQQSMMELQNKVTNSHLQAVANMVSTLTELEFVQQSLDFQDEFDKTKMHLFGLSETQFTLDELAQKSGLATSIVKKHTSSPVNAIKAEKVNHHCRGDTAPHNGTMQQTMMSSQTTKMHNKKKTQKEVDADELALNQEHPIAVQLSDECTSCGDPRIKKKINTAFKLACVQYKPSWVLYRGNRFIRKRLIEAKRQILDAEWALMIKYEPFKELFGETPNEKFNANLIEKLGTYASGPRQHIQSQIDRVNELQHTKSDFNSTKGFVDATPSFLDTSNMLNHKVSKLTEETQKYHPIKSIDSTFNEFEGKTQATKITINTQERSKILASDSLNNGYAQEHQHNAQNREVQGEGNSMLQLIDRLDGSTILDTELDSKYVGAHRISPRMQSQPYATRNAGSNDSRTYNEYTKRISPKKQKIVLGSTTSAKKHNESIFSHNEDLVGGGSTINADGKMITMLPSLQMPDEFGALPHHNLSHITQVGNHRIREEVISGDGSRFAPIGCTSQSLMHRASPLSNAKMNMTGRGSQQSRVNQKQARGSSITHNKAGGPAEFDEQMLLSMRQLVGKQDHSPSARAQLLNQTFLLKGIVEQNKDRYQDTKDQREMLIAAARMRKGKGTGGGGLWNHRKTGSSFYKDRDVMSPNETMKDFCISSETMATPTNVNQQQMAARKGRQHYSRMTQDNSILHTEALSGDIGLQSIAESTTALKNIAFEKSEVVVGKSLVLPQINQVKVDPIQVNEALRGQESYRQSLLIQTEQKGTGPPTPLNPREVITINGLVGINSGRQNNLSKATVIQEDLTTVRGSVSGTKKILGIVQRKDSIGTDEDNVKIGFGDESMDMTRNLIVEHKVNRSTVYEKMGFNVASSSKAINMGTHGSSAMSQGIIGNAMNHNQRETSQNKYVRLKSPSSESALTNSFYDTRPGQFPGIQQSGMDDFGPRIVASQQRQIENQTPTQGSNKQNEQ